MVEKKKDNLLSYSLIANAILVIVAILLLTWAMGETQIIDLTESQEASIRNEVQNKCDRDTRTLTNDYDRELDDAIERNKKCFNQMADVDKSIRNLSLNYKDFTDDFNVLTQDLNEIWNQNNEDLNLILTKNNEDINNLLDSLTCE